MNKKMYQHLKAENDANGNPRRLYLIINEKGVVLNALDEGYVGKWILDRAGYDWEDMIELPDINITVTEYNNIKRTYVWGYK